MHTSEIFFIYSNILYVPAARSSTFKETIQRITI
jgi:hypothetical protein